MEKIAIQLWKNTNLEDNEFKGFLLNEFPSALKDEILSYQVNLADDDVSDASGLIQSSYPPSPNAVLFLKVNSLFHVEQKLNILDLQWFNQIENIGNTVSATIPIAISILQNENKFSYSKKYLLMGFGVGLSVAGCIIS